MIRRRTAIVTGAAKGIGRAIAERLLVDGFAVAIADIDGEGAHGTADLLSSLGEVIPIVCDVSHKSDVSRMIETVCRRLGPIDGLVNNAGILMARPFFELEEADFDKVVAVNLKGCFLCCQTVGRHMVEQILPGATPGAIVNISSIQARMTGADYVAYAATKAGISQMTAAVSLALAPYGIRVNAVAPGTIATDFIGDLPDDIRRSVISRTPLGRIGTADEIAAAVAFFLSDAASYVTGQTLYADGGRTSLAFMMPSTAEKPG